MKRLTTERRANWRQTVLNQGLVYLATERQDGSVIDYFREGSFYSFTTEERDLLDRASCTLYDMCIEAGDYIVSHPELMSKMGIPSWAFDQIIATWNEEPAAQSVYGRFDIRFGGLDHQDASLRTPRLYEFNPDTPTSLLESAWIQWRWLADTGEGRDQWNYLNDNLVKAWRRILPIIERKLGHRSTVHFAVSTADEEQEDLVNCLYMLDMCRQAGYATKTIYVENIVLGKDGRFYDEQGDHIDVIFKLYRWEDMVNDEFGKAIFADMENVGKRDTRGNYTGGTIWIEPPYKMLWSTKGLLAVLWQLFGSDPERSQYLIPTWFEGDEPEGLTEYVRKPLHGREGANITVIQAGQPSVSTPGEYGAEGYVIQAYAPPPMFETDDQPVYPVLGIWLVDDVPSGMGIRESEGVVTDHFCYFAPHSISDGPTSIALVRSVAEPVTTMDYSTSSSSTDPTYVGFNTPSFGRTN